MTDVTPEQALTALAAVRSNLVLLLRALPTDGGLTVMDEILVERARQDVKWGEQNHRDGTGLGHGVLIPGPGFPALRQEMKRQVDLDARLGTSEWSKILLEEVFEACAESSPAAIREELIQVAAVAIQWIQAIDRRPS